jgi:ribosomal protein S12 methylthiotransferase
MGRKGGNALIREVIGKARTINSATLRTSLIVGFPGETARIFEKLLAFIREVRFDHLGVFTYSREEGTQPRRSPCASRSGKRSGVGTS